MTTGTVGDRSGSELPARLPRMGARWLTMARTTASVYTSHVPAIGAAMDPGRTETTCRAPLFAVCPERDSNPHTLAGGGF